MVRRAASTEEETAAQGRAVQAHLPVAERRGSFAEVDLALDERAARCEAQRCLRCDLDFTRPQA